MLLGVFGGRALEGVQTKWIILQALQGNADGIPQAPLRNEFPFQNLPFLVSMLFIVEFPMAYPTIGTRKISEKYVSLFDFQFFLGGGGGQKDVEREVLF